MNKETLDTAIHLGQLITLLTPIANGSKAFSKRLSRLRAGVESQVALSVLAAKTDAGSRAQTRINEVHTALLGAFKRQVDVPELLRRSATAREVYAMQVITGVRRMDCDSVLLGDAEAVKLEPNPGKGSDQAARAAVVHAYVSAVRNSTWLPTLLRLELGLGLATNENARLTKEYSTHNGQEALSDTLLKLCPTYIAGREALGNELSKLAPGGAKLAPKRARAKKVAVAAECLFTVLVACKAETLLAQADIAALASVTFKGAEPAPKLAELLEKATTPVPVGPDDTPAAVAQRIVDELVTALTARKKLADDERAAIRAKAEAAAADSAVAALQQLNPALVAALKKNPALLERV
jgi:hypothetical protein